MPRANAAPVSVTIGERRRSRLLRLLLLSLVAIPVVFPFWWMITSSLKPAGQIFESPKLLPDVYQWNNYLEVFAQQPFARQYANSLYISLTVTVLTLVVASMAGFAFARIRFKGASVLFIMVLTALMMPIEVTIVPNFFLFSWLDLTGTHLPIILLQVFAVNAVLGTFIMRQFFLALPTEVEEAARIDGLSPWGIYWRIALPLATPALAAVAILSFWQSWNAFLEPLVFLDDVQQFTLPLALNNFSDVYGEPLWHLQMAATTLTVLPILAVYAIARRKVVSSFTLAGSER